MKERIRGLCVQVLLPLVLLASQVLASGALAQDGGASERERAAKAAFEAGVRAAESGDNARARAEFLHSRQLVVKASTLLNLAIVDLKLGLVDEALDALDALELPARSPEHERMLQRARELRHEAETLRQSSAQAGPNAAPEAPPAAAGQALPIAATPEPPASAQAARRAEPPAAPGAAGSVNGPRALLIAAGALAGAAIGGAVWWQDRSQAADACNPGGGRVCSERAQIEREQTAAKALTLSLGASALVLATSGSIWLVRRKHDTRDTRLSAWAAPGVLGASLRGSF